METKVKKETAANPKSVRSKTVPLYPRSAEREMKRLSDAYINEMIKDIKLNLSDIISDRMREYRTDSGEEESDDVKKHREHLESVLISFGLVGKIRRVAEITERSSLREWKKCVRSTLGIDVPDGYYIGGIYEESVKKWIRDTATSMLKIPNRLSKAVEKIIERGIQRKKSVKEIREEVIRRLNSEKRYGRVLAIAAIAFLAAGLNRRQQEDAGCRQYVWSTAKDSRVRACHRSLEGKVFSWDNPPEMWKETKSGIVYTGRRCNPGEDFGCRCVAIPVFDYDKLNLPYNTREERKL